MDWIRAGTDWFTGGQYEYMTLYHCMGGDTLWVGITVALDLAVAAGYTFIAWHWQKNQRQLPPGEARRALGYLRNIFIFCGICGYIFIPIKMFWPAWRLYDVVMLVLAWSTWQFALNTRHLRVVYREINRSHDLAEKLDKERAESRNRSLFLNAIGHDLRTPLHGMALQAELAEAQLENRDPASARQSLQTIRHCTEEVNRLLERFLEIGRLDWTPPAAAPSEVVDASTLTREVVELARPEADRKGLTLSAALPPGLTIHSERDMIARVLSNLVGNAIKHTQHGGVEVLLNHDGDEMVWEVVDTGPGIAPGLQERVFDEFYQVANKGRDRGRGFGLGLAITRRLVDRLGGRLELDSEPGRGSRFRVALPIRHGLPAPTQTPALA